MEIAVDEETMWWCLKAGRGGVLEDDWLDRGIVTTEKRKRPLFRTTTTGGQ